MANQDTFSASTTAQFTANSYDFKSWLDARLPEGLVNIQNEYEDDIIDTMANMFDTSYQKVKYLPKLGDIDDSPQIYLVKLSQLLGIEDFDLLKAKLAATSGTTEGDYTENDIATFRRYIKEAVFRYKKKGTIEAVTKIFYYLNYLIDVEELWTKNWVQYFPKDKILEQLSSDLELDDLYSMFSFSTTGLSVSGSTQTISELTSGGQIVRIVQSYNGTKFVIVNGTANNKLFWDTSGNGYVDTGIEEVTDIWTSVHCDPFNPTDTTLKYGVVSYIKSSKVYVQAETDITDVVSTYDTLTVNKFLTVDDSADDRYAYIETTNTIERMDSNFLNFLTFIDKTQYGQIPTVTADYVIPLNDDKRLYFFKRESNSNNDFTILARGWNQNIPEAITTTSVPFSASTSGTVTSAFVGGTTTLYNYLAYGSYTSGGTEYHQYTYQDSTSGYDSEITIYHVNTDELGTYDTAYSYTQSVSAFTSAYAFNDSLTPGTSAVAYNIPDFRIKNARSHYDVYLDRERNLINITYQKGSKIYRDFYHQIESGIDPHKRNTSIILASNVLKYLDSEQTENYIIRTYIDTSYNEKVILEAKTSGIQNSLQTFGLDI